MVARRPRYAVTSLESAGEQQLHGLHRCQGADERRLQAALGVINVTHSLLLFLDDEGHLISQVSDFLHEPVEIVLVMQLEDHVLK